MRVLDLQVFSHDDLVRELGDFRPEAVGFGLNYLATGYSPDHQRPARSDAG